MKKMDKYNKDECYDYKTSLAHDVKMITKKGIKEVMFVHPNKRFISLVLKNNQKYTVNGSQNVNEVIKLFRLSNAVSNWRKKNNVVFGK